MNPQSGAVIAIESSNDPTQMRRERFPSVDDDCHSVEHLIKPGVLTVPEVEGPLRLLELASILDELPRRLLPLARLLFEDWIGRWFTAEIRNVDPAVAERAVGNFTLLGWMDEKSLLAARAGQFKSHVIHRSSSSRSQGTDYRKEPRHELVRGPDVRAIVEVQSGLDRIQQSRRAYFRKYNQTKPVLSSFMNSPRFR